MSSVHPPSNIAVAPPARSEWDEKRRGSMPAAWAAVLSAVSMSLTVMERCLPSEDHHDARGVSAVAWCRCALVCNVHTASTGQSSGTPDRAKVRKVPAAFWSVLEDAKNTRTLTADCLELVGQSCESKNVTSATRRTCLQSFPVDRYSDRRSRKK